ncbi:hypothetical protein ACLQ25_02435 [Micromonospora sp. DT44]|uniref:hypothetical protein n=1 Tax=Micromonospora sp. DT44 TaxID=3393439 RepID=UPI003CE77FF2
MALGDGLTDAGSGFVISGGAAASPAVSRSDGSPRSSATTVTAAPIASTTATNWAISAKRRWR